MTEENQAPEVEQEKPSKAPAKSKKSDTVTNVYKAPFMVCGHRVMPGKSHELSSKDKADEKGMARLENAIRKGYLERG